MVYAFGSAEVLSEPTSRASQRRTTVLHLQWVWGSSATTSVRKRRTAGAAVDFRRHWCSARTPPERQPIPWTLVPFWLLCRATDTSRKSTAILLTHQVHRHVAVLYELSSTTWFSIVESASTQKGWCPTNGRRNQLDWRVGVREAKPL